MAIYVAIHKVCDDTESAEYVFGRFEQEQGRLRVDKSTGEIDLITAAPGDDDGSLYLRARHKIRQHWAENEFPDDACWAS